MANSSTPIEGLLFVTMQPKETLSQPLFDDWYNNEHGPNRTRQTFITNGFRYRATDLGADAKTGTQAKPEYLAIYDIEDMHQMTLDPYMKFRSSPWKTQREIDVMAQIHVHRTMFDVLGEEKNAETFVVLEASDKFKEEAEGNHLTTSRFVTDSEDTTKVDELMTKSILPAIKTIPGWRRTKWYKRSYLEDAHPKGQEILIIHEFTPSTNLASLDLTVFNTTSIEIPQSSTTRLYELFYTFGSAARHLPVVAPWKAYDNITRTYPPSSKTRGASAVESTVTTPDGTILPFRLEGLTTDPTSPVIVLVNSVLVTYGIWDGFVSHFLSQPENQKYRVLRYNSRGRFSNTGSTGATVTVDRLASDIICVLNALRIPSASCLIGVSLGGATALATALTYPDRIQSFISCDTSAKSPAGNRETWGKRIDVAEKEGKSQPIPSLFDDDQISAPPGVEPQPEPVVGEELAEMTVRRWFAATSYEDATLSKEIERVKRMVMSNSLPGFARGVEALFDYDYTGLLGGYQGRAALVVGKEDGVLPKSMGELAGKIGGDGGVKCEVVEGAGHLPMVEKPREVAGFVTGFLKGEV